MVPAQPASIRRGDRGARDSKERQQSPGDLTVQWLVLSYLDRCLCLRAAGCRRDLTAYEESGLPPHRAGVGRKTKTKQNRKNPLSFSLRCPHPRPSLTYVSGYELRSPVVAPGMSVL